MANNYQEFSTALDCGTLETREALYELCEELDAADSMPCEYERRGDTEIWLYAQDYVDTDGLVAFLRDCFTRFPQLPPVAVTWSNTCSKPRIDQFGGGGVVVTRDGAYYADAFDRVSVLQQAATRGQPIGFAAIEEVVRVILNNAETIETDHGRKTAAGLADMIRDAAERYAGS